MKATIAALQSFFDVPATNAPHAVFDVCFEGLEGLDDNPHEDSAIYAVAADSDPGKGFWVDEHGLDLRRLDQVGDDEGLLVMECLSQGSLTDCLVQMLDVAIRDTTEGSYTFREALESKVGMDDLFGEFLGSRLSGKRNAKRLAETIDAHAFDDIDDAYLRELLAHTLTPFYVRTTFDFDGVEGDPLEEIVSADGIEKWLGWASIVGVITGETDTGARTFLVRQS